MRPNKLTVLTGLSVLTLVMLGPAGFATASRTQAAVTHQPKAALSSSAITSARAAARTRPLSPATYPSVSGRFYHVAATSANDVWAVGLPGGSIWHWNGSSWVSYPFSQGFQGVSAQSPADAWAVGGSSWFQPSSTVAYHWNGKTWRRVPTPTPGATAWFNAVSATSPANAWAVGCICGGPGDLGFAVPIIEHWNGKVWRRQLFNLPQNSGQFLAVAAISASNAWAVGGTTKGAANGALIEHWNGTRWKRISPGTANGRGFLQGVTATGPDDIWAVGYNVPQAGSLLKSLILHWNGRSWSVAPSPIPTSSTNLWAVSATSPSNAWAVGYTSPNGCYCGTAAFHWNGKRWTVVRAANPPASSIDALLGVVAISPSDAWAVGATDWSSTIIEHWNGKTWQT